VIVFLVGGALNLALYLGPIRAMRIRLPLRVVVLSFGAALVVRSTAEKIWGIEIFSSPAFVGVPETVSVVYERAVLSGQVAYLTALLVLVVAAIWYLETRTRLGRNLRAVGSDSSMAQTFGVRVGVVFSVAFFLGGAVAAIAGFYMLPVLFMTSHSGTLIGLKALTAAVVGGMSGRLSVVAGGLLVGFVNQFTAAYVGAGWQDFAVFLMLIVILLIRPHGLFTKSGG